MGRRVLLAVNPRARRGRHAFERVAGALGALGHDVVTVSLDGPPAALSEAILSKKDSVDVVAVGGGDGTLLAALDGLIASQLPLVIFPLGTFNDFARTLGVPFQPARAAALVEHGTPVSVGVGRVNGRYYLNEASVRISPAVARLQFGTFKSRRAGLALPILLKALAIRPRLHLEVEDEQGRRFEVNAVILTVANNYHFAGVIENPEASLREGKLWLYALDVGTPADTARLLAAILMRRRLTRVPQLLALSGRRFVVRSLDGGRQRISADAEYAGELPAEFTATPNAVTVLVPAANIPNIR